MRINLPIVFFITIILLTSCGGGNNEGVYGKVSDNEAGKPVSGASVELECNNCNAHFTANTDTDGHYSFPDALAGNYVLTITWNNPPSCPGITPFQTLGTSGDFVLTYAGYGGLGGAGDKRIIAVVEFELEQSKKLDLKIACP